MIFFKKYLGDTPTKKSESGDSLLAIQLGPARKCLDSPDIPLRYNRDLATPPIADFLHIDKDLICKDRVQFRNLVKFKFALKLKSLSIAKQPKQIRTHTPQTKEQ